MQQPQFANVDAFPVLGELIHLNHAGVAPISGPAARALRDYADHAARYGPHRAGWHRHIREIRTAAARLIHARGPHEIAFVANTSTGLAVVAEGLDWRRGDNVVITSIEYPANRYPWQNLARRGVELIEIEPQRDGRIDVEDVVEAITDRTRVVSISHVQFSTGQRIDLKPIAETVHRAGGYLCVDAIQSVGALPVDVQAMGIDFLAADGHKWMLGPEGAGIFYCHEELIPLVHPPIVGWLNMVNALDFLNYRFELREDAQRFEAGSYNVPGILALGASIDLLLEVGMDTVAHHVEAVTTHLCERLGEKGYRVYSPRTDGAERSGIVVFEPPAGKPAVEHIVAELERAGIVIVVRGGRLRASPHFYNTMEQMDRLVEALP
ncbi:MAG: aminotransferase class V-fold PLP-dependent enzyme [Phycisphaeraceae bacterium]